MKPFDPTKPVQTRDGRKARILATDLVFDVGTGETRIAAAVAQENLIESAIVVKRNGQITDAHPTNNDLVNIPERIDGWVNVYRWTTPASAPVFSQVYPTREQADRDEMSGRIACIKVSFTKGEGL